MGEPSIDTLHDPYEDQLSAARYKAERDAAVQELQGLRERNLELWMDCGMSQELVTCAEEKSRRLGHLVWRLQNRLAKAHRRERNLRKGMRMWRERAISGPVRTVSAYDLLPEDDLQTLRWVREHGGLDIVKKLLDWVVGHCSTKQQLDFDFWLSGRVMYELGFDEDMADRDEVERRLLARLMPEGYEWPRYESGEPVRIGDVVNDVEVRSVVFRDGGILLSDCTSVPGWGTWRSYKEPIKRPSVPAGDGEPLEAGQTVWDVESGEELKVEELCDVGLVQLLTRDGVSRYVYPDDLTHTKPNLDTWERIEEDATKNPFDYCKDVGHRLDTCENAERFKSRDLVRRARKLAEKENKNE